MLGWIILVVALVVIFMFLRHEHHYRIARFFVIIIILLLILFFVFVTFTNDSIDLSDSKGIISAVSLYFSWISNIFVGLWDAGSYVTGKVINALNYW